jgi:hypothetical protein
VYTEYHRYLDDDDDDGGIAFDIAAKEMLD